MTTPIERAAEVIVSARMAINGYYRDAPEQVARAVFETIDREEIRTLALQELERHRTQDQDIDYTADLLADAILAHLLEGEK